MVASRFAGRRLGGGSYRHHSATARSATDFLTQQVRRYPWEGPAARERVLFRREIASVERRTREYAECVLMKEAILATGQDDCADRSTRRYHVPQLAYIRRVCLRAT